MSWIIETIICETVDQRLANPVSVGLIQQLNPVFKAPEQPFKCIACRTWNQARAEDAEGNVPLDESGHAKMVDHVVGDDIAEGCGEADDGHHWGRQYSCTHPSELKAFYTKKLPVEEGAKTVYTESPDLLMQNVGEIVGGSMSGGVAGGI